MDDTLASWLELREGPDAVARSTTVTQALIDAVAGHEHVRVLDLGTGTGANVRYLMPHLQRRQEWVIVDRDGALLALVPNRMSSWAAAHGWHVDDNADSYTIHNSQLTCEIRAQVMDLGRLDQVNALFAGRHVVTASALLDLASEQWLTSLADQCHATGAAALFALSYNGWSTCTPVEREDELMRDLLNRHQRRDTGLGGPAAGPYAAASAAHSFANVGYHVRTELSDWRLGPSQNELQRRLVDGWSEVAMSLMSDEAETIQHWRRRRHAHIDANRSHIVVGHVDLAAWPGGTKKEQRRTESEETLLLIEPLDDVP